MYLQAQSCNALRHAHSRSRREGAEEITAKSRKPRRVYKAMDAGYGSYFEERDLFSSAAIGSRSKTASWMKKRKKKGSVSLVHPKETALHAACTADQQKIVSLLLKRGAQLDVVDAIGNTAMHRCARHCNTECAKLLLEQKADWRERNEDGLTALQIATKHEHQEMVMLLHT